MTPRRVLHLIDTGGPGGAETVFLELVRGLPHLGWDSIAVVPEENWLSGALRAAGVTPIIVPSEGSFNARYALELRGLIRSEGVEIVQSHLLGSALYGAIACTGLDVPIIGTFHGRPDIPVDTRLRRLKIEFLRRRLSHVVFVSESLRAHFSEMRLPSARTASTVIPNGVDLEVLDSDTPATMHEILGLNGESRLIGAVGNIRPSKAYDVLLRAFASIRRSVPTAHLLIAGQGGGPLHEELLDLRGELGLDGTCHFLGFVEDVASFLASLDVFVLSSSDEGFSLALAQAMAKGLPAVATRCGGPEDIVGDSRSVVLVEPGDEESLSEAVVRLLNDDVLATELGQAARRHARSRYSLSAMVHAYSELYEACLGRNGQP